MADSIPLINKNLNVRNFYDPHRLETFTDNYAVKAIPALFITTPMLNFDSSNIDKSDFSLIDKKEIEMALKKNFQLRK